METVWVLRAAYGFDRADVVAALVRLLATEGMAVESEGLVRAALSDFETGEADFADYLILQSARHADSLPLWTFDRRLSRATGAEPVP